MKRIFTLKTYGSKLYKWSPPQNNKLKKTKKGRPFYCDAKAGSQGQDWISTYTYETIVVDGILQKLAYVECGYSE